MSAASAISSSTPTHAPLTVGNTSTAVRNTDSAVRNMAMTARNTAMAAGNTPTAARNMAIAAENTAMPAGHMPMSVGYMPMPKGFPHKDVFLHGRPQHRKYDDFWIRHPPMDVGRRAKIFAPFDALRGFDFCIMSKQVQYTERKDLSEMQKEQLNQQLTLLQALTCSGPAARESQPLAEVTYFEPCADPENFAYEKGGQYKTITGIVSKVDALIDRTITVGGMDIPLDAISQICTQGCSDATPYIVD